MRTTKLIVRNATMEDLPQIATLYVRCFAEPPWNEVFDASEVEKDFRDCLGWKDGVFIVGCDDRSGDIAGAAMGFALERHEGLPDEIRKCEQGAFYIAEIFVDSAHRARGVAGRMTEELIAGARVRGFKRGVVRTSIHQLIIQKMFQKTGFLIVARQSVASTKSTGESTCVESDERIILVGDLF